MNQHFDTFVNYISHNICDFIAKDVLQNDYYQQGIMEIIDGKPTGKFNIDTNSRFVLCGTKFCNPTAINSIIQKIVNSFIEPRYMCKVRCWESPQLLFYPENGGHYKPHVDSEQWYDDVGWKKVTNRDITLLVYLDEEYEGGELVFPDIGITMRPKKGQIVTFPSNRNFKHGVLPVTRGTRRVLVCWLTVWGESLIVPLTQDSKVFYSGQYL